MDPGSVGAVALPVLGMHCPLHPVGRRGKCTWRKLLKSLDPE